MPEHDFNNARPRKDTVLYRRMGRTAVSIRCPFCGYVTTGFIWSLSGSGKKCPGPGCGALHWMEKTVPLKKPVKCVECQEPDEDNCRCTRA